MTSVVDREVEVSLGPREITPDNVQYWSHHTQEFAQSQVHKAKKFLEYGCIEYSGEGFFICKPIPGYNSRTYTIKKNSEGKFECNCQKAMQGSETCSHVLALYYAFKIKQFKPRKMEDKDGVLG